MTSSYTVRIAFLDVGQGDSIVVSIPETQEAVIVDCPDAVAVFEYLRAQHIRHIRGLLITHLHLDHFKDTVKFLENCSTQLGTQCERLIFNWPSNRKIPAPDADNHDRIYPNDRHNERQKRTAYQELLSWTNMHEDDCLPVLRERAQMPLNGSIPHIIKILQPSHGQMGKLLELGLNNTSAILRVQGSGTSALLTADIEPAGWRELQQRNSNLHSDILKFPHHGAWKDANPDEILDSVQPSVVVISVGSDGTRYDHPNAHVFQALAARPEIRLLCTQATRQCGSEVPHVRSKVTNEFEQATETHAVPLIRTTRGCPCAGTVILELGDHIRVIQPEITFHHDRIIRQYFHHHKCAI
jgi:beta-lactamase superfamily II metal-dependent hydrolase